MRARVIDLNYRDTPNIFQNIVFLLFIMDASALKMYCYCYLTVHYYKVPIIMFQKDNLFIILHIIW